MSIDEFTYSNYAGLPALDLDMFKHTYGVGDWKSMLEIFVAEAPADIERIGQDLTKRDRARLLRDAHSLKGASGTMCATRLQSLCLKLEDAARAENWSEAEKLGQAINSEFRELATIIGTLLSGGDRQ